MTPQDIVAELDRHIVGQAQAKRAVAIALRNRWRRQQLPEGLREEIELIADTAKLQTLLRAAIRSATLEEFAEAI